jgi:hypothetical protein
MSTSVYHNAIRNLSGEQAWGRFEQFVELVAWRRFHGHKIKVEHPENRKALVDVLVYNQGNEERLIAQIECKAYMQEKYPNTNSLLSGFGWPTIKKRVEKLNDCSKGKPQQLIIATTATIETDEWKNYSDKHDLSDYTLWHAEELASFTAADPVLASYLSPELGWVSDKYKNHALELLMIRQGDLAIPFLNLIAEPLDELPYEFTQPTLLYGPPFVGKTCWAVKQAWAWMRDRQNENWTTFLLNASRDEPTLVKDLVDWHGVKGQFLFIVDDIHFAGKHALKWMQQIEDIAPKCDKLAVLWIARTDDVLRYLRTQQSEPLINKQLSFKDLAKRFSKKLVGYTDWQRTIAALLTGLDITIADSLPKPMDRSRGSLPGTAMIVQTAHWLRNEVKRVKRERLAAIKDKLNNEAWSMYCVLIPFGSISLPVHDSMLAELVDNATTSIFNLEKNGLVSYKNDIINMTQHPFQLWRLLENMGYVPSSLRGVHALQNVQGINGSNYTFSEMAFLCYILVDNEEWNARVEALNKLVDYAEWAGVIAPMRQALERLLTVERTEDNEHFYRAAQIHYRKLARTSYPKNQEKFIEILCHHQEKWKQEKSIADSEELKKYRGIRLDTILYEIAYISYLREEYQQACDLFRQSTKEGLRMIEKAMNHECTQEVWDDGAAALSHIWVAALLQHVSLMRHYILLAVSNGDKSCLLEKMRKLAYDVCEIHKGLRIANKAEAEEERQTRYLNALKAACPSWEPPPGHLPLKDKAEAQIAFMRHDCNAWIHAIEVSCWPTLFGVCDTRIETDVRPTERRSPQNASKAPVTGLPAYRLDACELLYRIASGQPSDDLHLDALAVAAVLRAGDGFEYLGDYVLLAWRYASSEETAAALAWYLRTEVPHVGFGGLAKEALESLERDGRRQAIGSRPNSPRV